MTTNEFSNFQDDRLDQDSPWKELLELYFDEFMAFFFPAAHQQIDWARGYEFLDKELQQIIREADTGRRYVDKLVKVWLKEASREAWILIHLEIQAEKEKAFEKRMYVYNYRLFDRYDRQVASFAVLADRSPKWKPSKFQYELLGTEVCLKYQVVKLTDYRKQSDVLESSSNPFAIAVMAHLKTQQTRNKPNHRYASKFLLVKLLYQKGFQKRKFWSCCDLLIGLWCYHLNSNKN